MLDEKWVDYTQKIVRAIWGNRSWGFQNSPNRRLDLFFKSKYLSQWNASATDRCSFDMAFKFLKQQGFITVLKVEDSHIWSTYFDEVDISCSYVKEVYDKCFVSLTEDGMEAWYNFRSTGNWERDDES